MRSIVTDLKQFLEFLNSRGLISENLFGALDVYTPRNRKIYQGFTEDESNHIIAVVDRNTDMSKRDYAILLLVKYTGLRGIDIRKLKLKDIIWESKEFHGVQSKTSKPLILPLQSNVGNAIADYILNARPPSSDNHIFLRIRPPHVGFTDISDIVVRYANLSGVAKETKVPIGFHSFRRAMGISLLEAEVPLSIISEILGHAGRNSTKRYIALDVDRLRKCAMPMEAFPCRKEALC
jgi:integrase